MQLARLRDDQAWDLHLRGASASMIATTLGVTVQQARRIRTRTIAAHTADPETLERMRLVAQARIDQRRLEANRILAAHHPVLERGVPVTVTRSDRDAGGQPIPGTERTVELEDDGVKLSALDRLAKCDADERALWGMEAAQKFEHGGEDGGPIAFELRLAELKQRTEAVHLRALEPPPDT